MSVTTEFYTLVEDAVCAEVLRLCGTGAEAYQTPEYLQIQNAEPGLLVPQFDIREAADFPLFVAQYTYTEPAVTQTGMGRDERLTHVWAMGVQMELTRDNMALTQVSDLEFFRNVQGASRLVMERVRRAINLFAPLVADTTFAGSSHKTEHGVVTIARPWLRRKDENAYEATLFYEWMLEGELHFD